MHRIEVSGFHDGTFIFTVTDHDHAPWGSSNTTIFVPPEQLAGLVAKLQARLQEVEQIRQATPVFAVRQQVRILGHFRPGQYGTIVTIEEKPVRMQQVTGEQWLFTVAFRDGSTWVYNASELEPIGRYRE